MCCWGFHRAGQVLPDTPLHPAIQEVRLLVQRAAAHEPVLARSSASAGPGLARANPCRADRQLFVTEPCPMARFGWECFYKQCFAGFAGGRAVALSSRLQASFHGKNLTDCMPSGAACCYYSCTFAIVNAWQAQCEITIQKALLACSLARLRGLNKCTVLGNNHIAHSGMKASSEAMWQCANHGKH